jgi:hypothetical protein
MECQYLLEAPINHRQPMLKAHHYLGLPLLPLLVLLDNGWSNFRAVLAASDLRIQHKAARRSTHSNIIVVPEMDDIYRYLTSLLFH